LTKEQGISMKRH